MQTKQKTTRTLVTCRSEIKHTTYVIYKTHTRKKNA